MKQHYYDSFYRQFLSFKTADYFRRSIKLKKVSLMRYSYNLTTNLLHHKTNVYICLHSKGIGFQEFKFINMLHMFLKIIREAFLYIYRLQDLVSVTFTGFCCVLESDFITLSINRYVVIGRASNQRSVYDFVCF